MRTPLLHPAAGVFHLLPFLAEALFGDWLGGAQFRGKDGDAEFFQEFQVFLLAALAGQGRAGEVGHLVQAGQGLEQAFGLFIVLERVVLGAIDAQG